MPVSIVVGGQFGSEGKGKVALEIVRRTRGPIAVVRVGGPNSGHTAYDRNGKRWALRQMPAACVDRNVDVVFPAGSFLDVDLLLEEIDALDYPVHRIHISEHANIITAEQKEWERQAALGTAIGSTGAGVGASMMAAVAREAANFPLLAVHARDIQKLERYLADTTMHLSDRLAVGARVVVEGTQGFGLSLLDGGYWPKATSRCTTAAAALAEAGLSPLHVDDVTLVIRSFPIRVAGNSGKLPHETTWEEIAKSSGRKDDLTEYTTVTKRIRRVGRFDHLVVKKAIAANCPNRIVMNHLDYIGSHGSLSETGSPVARFLATVEIDIERRLDWLGFSPISVTDRIQQAV